MRIEKTIASFVLECVKAPSLGTEPSEPAFLEEASAWRAALDFSLKIHSAMPFLAQVERASWKSRIPEGAWLELDERLQRERMLLAILDEELDAALFALISARIPVIALKGTELSRRYYAERVHRPMTDIDLLVKPEDFLDALKSLGRADYRVVGEFPEGRIRVELSRRPNAPVVELHRALLAGDDATATEEVWKNAKAGEIPGLPRVVGALSPEDNLSYLIRHGAIQHVLESPIWLNDIHYLLSHDGFAAKADWDRITWSLARSRSLSAGWFVLAFLKSEWGTAIPDEALGVFTRRTGALRRRLLARMISARRWFDDSRRTRSWVIRSRLLLRDDTWNAIRYGISRLSSPQG